MKSDFDRLVEILKGLDARLVAIEAAVKSCCPPRALNAALTAVYGRSNAMPVVIPVPQLLDTEKILLSVMPRLTNGRVDTEAVVTWASSDPAQVGVEPGVDPFVFHDPQTGEDYTVPGAYNAFALTPLASGTGTVTVSAPGYESAEFGPIVYAPGVPRSLNASVGSPISDLS
jgi:hypothetical protein